MVSFSSLTRPQAKCSDLLSCFLDLNELEIRLFYTILSNRAITLDEMSEKMSKDRSTIFRNLQKLVSLGLIYKEILPLEKGGRIATFHAQDIGEIKEIVSQRVESLKRSMDAFMKDFEKRISNEMVIYGEKDVALKLNQL